VRRRAAAEVEEGGVLWKRRREGVPQRCWTLTHAAVTVVVVRARREWRRAAADGEEGGDAYGQIYGPSNIWEYFCAAPCKVRHRMS
jgi:hypothetical protein